MKNGSIYEVMTDAEKQVAEYLMKLGIFWSYEAPVFVYDEKDRPRVWTPDFYLPQWEVYIEVCGDEKFNYEYREKIYKNNGFFIVFIHLYKEKEKWENFLLKRIIAVEEYRHNKAKNMLEKLLFQKQMN